jgi:DNA-binding transcriptional MerR regulator
VFRIGELSRAAGVTVRALHHYDRLGLLTPSERTSGGHRLYTEADVQRLYRLLALREIGLPLAEIGPALDADGSLTDTVRRHLEHVEHSISRLEAMREKLVGLLADESPQRFLDALEAMSMFEKYYSPEQLAQLAERKQQLGDEHIKAVEQEWAEIFAAVREHRLNGTDPADPGPQAIRRRTDELVEEFTGGDPGIRDSLRNLYANEGPERASRGMVNAEDMAYLEAIRQARS